MNTIRSDLNVPSATLVRNLQPWEIMGWSENQHRAIYRSWAQNLSQMRHSTAAALYFHKGIEDNTDDVVALCMRSGFNRRIAQAEAALDDARKADAIASRNAFVNLHIADALYDLNRFESQKILLHDNLNIHSGSMKLAFNRRLRVVDSNFQDSVGASLSPFFVKNLAKLRASHEEILTPEKPPEFTMRWRALKDLNECDVRSLTEAQLSSISPLEMARRKRKTKIYYQNYLHGSWIDILFLKNLRRNPIVLLKKYFNSAPEREEYLNRSYVRVRKFTKMLHARSPMYNEVYEKMANPEMSERFHQANMYRIQYQARRNMLSILRTIRALRAQKDVERLRKFVSKVMGEFVVLKTQRIVPWKMEFMNEVYNHLALSLCENYRLPDYTVSPYDKDSMCHLLGVSPFKPTEGQGVVFGDRSSYTYEDSGSAFEQAKKYKQTKASLHKRLHFSTLPIERSYLFYEIADCLLAENHLVHCLRYAKGSIDEARKANSKIWEFLATMLQAKAHAILCKFERQSDVFNSAYNLAKDLKSSRLCTFIELCRMLNRDYMTLRKMAVLVTSKRLRSRSNRSSTIIASQSSPDVQSAGHST